MHFRNTFWKFFEDLLTVTKIKKIDSEVVNDNKYLFENLKLLS